jgi:hypothetical protein
LSSTVRPKRWARLVKTFDARLSQSLSRLPCLCGTNRFERGFFARVERFSSDDAAFLKKSRSERNDSNRRQHLADKAFIYQRVFIRRGVASDLSFKIVPNLDTTFIGLIE